MAQNPYGFPNLNPGQGNNDPNTAATGNGQAAMAASFDPEQGFIFPGTPVQNVISSYVYPVMPVNFVPVLQQVDIFRRSGIPGSLLELNPQQFVIVPHQPVLSVLVPAQHGNIQGLQRFNSALPEHTVPFAERVAERYRVDNNQDYLRLGGSRPDVPRFSPVEQAEYLDPLGESEVWQSAYSTVITTARQIHRGALQNYPHMGSDDQVIRDSSNESVMITRSENLDADFVGVGSESDNVRALSGAIAEENERDLVDNLIRRMDNFSDGEEMEDSVYRRPHVTVLAQQLSQSVTHLLPDSLRELHDMIDIGRAVRRRSLEEGRNVVPSPELHPESQGAGNVASNPPLNSEAQGADKPLNIETQGADKPLNIETQGADKPLNIETQGADKSYDFENILHELQNLNMLESDSNVEQLHHSESGNQLLNEGTTQGASGGSDVFSLRGQVSDIINVDRLTDITHRTPPRTVINDNIHGNNDGARSSNICSANGSVGHRSIWNSGVTQSGVSSVTQNPPRSVTQNAASSVRSDMTQLDIRALRNQLQYDWTMNLGLPDAAETYNVLAGEMTGTILHELLRNLSTRSRNRVRSERRQSSLRQYYNNLVYQFYYETFLWLYLAITTDTRSIRTWALVLVISQIAGQSPEDVTVTMLAGFLESGISQTMEYTQALEDSFWRIERNRAVGPEDEMIMRELAMRMNTQLDPRRMLHRFGDVIRQAARALLIDASSSFPPAPQR